MSFVNKVLFNFFPQMIIFLLVNVNVPLLECGFSVPCPQLPAARTLSQVIYNQHTKISYCNYFIILFIYMYIYLYLTASIVIKVRVNTKIGKQKKEIEVF